MPERGFIRAAEFAFDTKIQLLTCLFERKLQNYQKTRQSVRFFLAIIWPRQARGPLKISQGCCEISTVARLMSKKSRKLMGKQSTVARRS